MGPRFQRAKHSLVSVVILYSLVLLLVGYLLPEHLALLLISPFYLLIALGCYCLGKLGVDLLAFHDCSAETPKLEKVPLYHTSITLI